MVMVGYMPTKLLKYANILQNANVPPKGVEDLGLHVLQVQSRFSILEPYSNVFWGLDYIMLIKFDGHGAFFAY